MSSNAFLLPAVPAQAPALSPGNALRGGSVAERPLIAATPLSEGGFSDRWLPATAAVLAAIGSFGHHRRSAGAQANGRRLRSARHGAPPRTIWHTEIGETVASLERQFNMTGDPCSSVSNMPHLQQVQAPPSHQELEVPTMPAGEAVRKAQEEEEQWRRQASSGPKEESAWRPVARLLGGAMSLGAAFLADLGSPARVKQVAQAAQVGAQAGAQAAEAVAGAVADATERLL